jgi:hypothetical protein
MLFGFEPVLSVVKFEAGTTYESSVSVYVATNMLPIEQVSPTEELRTEILHSSPQVQALFEQVMSRD